MEAGATNFVLKITALLFVLHCFVFLSVSELVVVPTYMYVHVRMCPARACMQKTVVTVTLGHNPFLVYC